MTKLKRLGVSIAVGVLTYFVMRTVCQSQSGATFTGVVRGMDEEAKIVEMIENARTFHHRLFCAFAYATAEIDRREDIRADYTTHSNRYSHIAAMNACIVIELRRAMLCQDAPKWVKEFRKDTVWWGTNVHNPGQYPWHWEPDSGTNGPGIDWIKVPERCYP